MKAVGFSIAKCKNLEDAYNLGIQYKDNKVFPTENMEDPLFYASIVWVEYPRGFDNHWLTPDHLLIPARKDASASVFQIISTISGDVTLANYCNVISPKNAHINDLYT